MEISVRVSAEDKALFQKYAKMHGLSLSEFVRQTVLERIEDEYDLAVAEKAMEEFRKDPVTYTMDEVEEALGNVRTRPIEELWKELELD